MKHKYKTIMLFTFSILTPAIGGTPPEEDRKAILAMAGEFEVDFNFAETVALQPDYHLKKEYTESAHEIVIVIEDTGNRIALQHLLLTGNGKGVVKHWTQIWTWEDSRITEFQGREKWNIRQASENEARGQWSQLVTQVDDSPRYESLGTWKHDGGYSRWQSEPTNRPLPRREHTTRKDYEVLLSINEHALTPHGWIHYQDNLKQVINDDRKVSRYLARERGLNHYEVSKEIDFTAAKEYWAATKDFWKLVSTFWDKVGEQHSSFEIRQEVDGKSMDRTLFELAEKIRDGAQPVPSYDEIAATIFRFVKPN